MKILPVLVTRRFSTLTTISGHLKGIVSHKNTQCYKLYVYLKKTYMYILAAYHFQWKCMGSHFFSRPSLHRQYYRTLVLSYSLILTLLA